MALQKKLALNKLEAEHEIAQINRNQKEIKYGMRHMANINNTDLNKLNR